MCILIIIIVTTFIIDTSIVTVLLIHISTFTPGFQVNWSCATASRFRPSWAPPACFPPGWMGETLQSRISSCVSTSTRLSLLEFCLRTWTCKAQCKMDRRHQLLHPSSPQKASQCTQFHIFQLLPTLETPSAASRLLPQMLLLWDSVGLILRPETFIKII